MKLPTKLTAVFDCIIDRLALLAGVLIIFLMLGVGAEVSIRYFLRGSPFPWLVEISEFSLVYITFLATAWVLKREGHVKMDVVSNRLNPRARSLTNIATSIIAAIVCFIIVWYGVKVTWDYYRGGYLFSTVLDVPQAVIMAIVPIGSFLLFIQFVRRTYGYLKDEERH